MACRWSIRFNSNVFLFPADQFGVVVLSNQHNSDISNTIANMISIRMLGLDHNKPIPMKKDFPIL
jgi:hypothetical protein